MWRSLVARMVRDHEAASSNLAIPTRNTKPSHCAGFLISGREFRVQGPESRGKQALDPMGVISQALTQNAGKVKMSCIINY